MLLQLNNKYYSKYGEIEKTYKSRDVITIIEERGK
jgi:hypothetical protein